jgi:hypothetical protein
MWTNAVYYPSYRVYRGDTPAQLNYNCISHVFYAFAGVGPDGGVFVSCCPYRALFGLTNSCRSSKTNMQMHN